MAEEEPTPEVSPPGEVAGCLTLLVMAAALIWGGWHLTFGGDDGDTKAARTAQVTTESTTTEARTDTAGEVERYLYSAFGPGSPTGGTSWYDAIAFDRMYWSPWNGKVTVRAALSSYNTGDAAAICLAIVLSGVDGVAGAHVTDLVGETLADCP